MATRLIARTGIGIVSVILAAAAAWSAPAPSVFPLQPVVPGECRETLLPGGARGLYCVPQQGWNGDVIVFAHGYTAVTEPLDYQNLTLGDVYLPDVAQQLGFAFATTTYRQNGLAIVEGVEDVRELVQAFARTTGRRANRFILSGASEGGIVTVLALEKYPRLFAGGLALCGPIGNFRYQADHIAHFRALFDYYFPGVLPGSAVSVPASVIGHWYDVHLPMVRAAIRARPDTTRELLDVARAAYVPGDTATVENTVEQLLWYHSFGTEDAKGKLGGNPFDNTRHVYRGSSDDARLNAEIGRFAADRVALRAMRPYTTSGRIERPLVVLHTRGDEVIPFAHNLIYLAKARAAGSTHLKVYPIERYGHCNFEFTEVLGGLLVLLSEMR